MIVQGESTRPIRLVAIPSRPPSPRVVPPPTWRDLIPFRVFLPTLLVVFLSCCGGVVADNQGPTMPPLEPVKTTPP